MKLIVNSSALEHTFIPNYLPRRENIRKNLLRDLLTFFSSNGKAYKGIHISGSIGSGKTVLARRIMEDIALETAKKVTIGYVNCRLSRRVYRVLSSIVNQIAPNMPKRGLSRDEFTDIIFLTAKQKYGRLLLVLDEIDSLFWGNEGSKATDFVYSLSRYVETLDADNFRFVLISISRDQSFIYQWLDRATRSSFVQEMKHLKRYDASDLFEILKYRASLAIREGGILDDELLHISNFVAKSAYGNARVALDLLRLSAEIAEEKGKDRIEPDHIRLAIQSYALIPVLDMESLIGLGKHKLLLILSIIRNLKETTRSYVTRRSVYTYYKEVCEEYGETPRRSTQMWRYLKEINYELGGILEIYVSGKNQKGRSTRISINVPLDILERKVIEAINSIT